MSTSTEVLATLASLENEKIRAVNARHGDDHAVNLTKLRAVAKDLKKNDELAAELWATGDTAARLVAILIMRPKAWSEARLDEMLRDSRVPRSTAGWSAASSRNHPTPRRCDSRGWTIRIPSSPLQAGR